MEKVHRHPLIEWLAKRNLVRQMYRCDSIDDLIKNVIRKGILNTYDAVTLPEAKLGLVMPHGLYPLGAFTAPLEDKTGQIDVWFHEGRSSLALKTLYDIVLTAHPRKSFDGMLYLDMFNVKPN